MIYNFECDYAEGALPEIIEALARTNLEQTSGYGSDPHCEHARAMIRALAGRECFVQFVPGGTQANLLVLTAALRPHEAAICADSGHINTHEAGAIEAAGHRVLSAGGRDGKLAPADIERVLAGQMPPHTVKPRLVYISQPTEWGTVYSLDELRALSSFCREHGLYLYADGARLGCAMACTGMTLADMAGLCDAFTIGGTKLGALFGEAIVINAPAIAEDFAYIVKQRGALLAKGRLLGVQFERLLAEDGLYLRAARHSVDCAQRMAAAFAARGLELRYPSPTNQIFPVLDERQAALLARTARFLPMEPPCEGRTLFRLVTSWATRPEAVDAVVAAIERM